MATIYGFTCRCDPYYDHEPDGCYSMIFKSAKARSDYLARTTVEPELWEKKVTRDTDEWKEAQ